MKINKNKTKFKWYGHVNTEAGQVLKMVEGMEVPGGMSVGTPRKMWRRTVSQNLEMLGVREEMVLSRAR